MNCNKFFYESDQYLSIDFSKKEVEILVSQDINKLFNNNETLNSSCVPVPLLFIKS